ncbi:MAG: S8 family serine peptidase [Sulfuricaulis sp.]|uniref:S8 family serine peptidase n=1 Tax=Sulfuricaulis sp. TaxID=2003553 RepID=UPI0034A384F3
MKMKKPIFIGILLLALSTSIVMVGQGSSATSVSSGLATGKNARQAQVSDEILIKFKPTVSLQSQELSVSRHGAKKIRALYQSGWVNLKLSKGLSVEAALVAYGNDPNVESVQPNYIYRIATAPNDSNYGQQWALKNTGQTITNSFTQPPSSSVFGTNNPGNPGSDMDLELAWDQLTDCSTVTVAVIDTGVNYNHVDLTANMWNGDPNHGQDFIDNDNDPMDLNGHGTHLAGIIGAVGNNGSGTTGVCWKASIMAVRVLDAAGNGNTATIRQGINFALTHGAKVINLSLSVVDPVFDLSFSDAITDAENSGVVVVVAAGNSGSNTDSGSSPSYPCNFTQSNLVCIAALDQKFQLASFSNYGATSVDVGAPGTNILSQWAGTNAAFPDNLTSSWTFNPATGGWGSVNLSGTQYLLNPTNYPSGQYNSSADDRVYKSFNITGDAAVLNSFRAINIKKGDHFRVGYLTTGSDPFSGGGIIVDDVTEIETFPFLLFVSRDITGCISATCNVGFQLQSDASLTDLGVAISDFVIMTLNLNTTSYNTINGTSMATPHVAGLAALVWAYNPSYTYTQVVNAIKNGGEMVTALSGKTTTGKAVNAMGSLAYINQPIGLSVSVQ